MILFKEILRWIWYSLLLACLPIAALSQEGYWNLKRYLIGPATTLSNAHVESVNKITGEVEVQVWDAAAPPSTWTFAWGDGCTDSGGTIQHHVYQDLTHNYFVTITGPYSDGRTDESETVVLFVPVQVEPRPLPTSLSVAIPDYPVTLVSRTPDHQPPSNWEPFDNGFFTGIPRATAEYVLTAGATVEADLVNGDFILIDGAFQQVILRDPLASWGAQAIFYTSPPAVGASRESLYYEPFFWSQLFHEMAHNFQMNSPADSCFGDYWIGNWSTYFFKEGLVRMLQVAPAYELINDCEWYGLSRELLVAIELNTIRMVWDFREAHDRYVDSGLPFTTWDDPNTGTWESLDIACVLATRFLMHAEEDGLGYRVPSKRLMKFVHTFDQEALAKWDVDRDTPEGEEFRSTFSVAALSFAFNEDLRDEFRALNFPISDEDYEALWQKADTDHADFGLAMTPTSLTVPRDRSVTCTIGTEALQGLTHEISFRARLATPIEGVSVSLSDKTVNPGGTVTVTVTANAAAPLSTSSIRLQSEGEYTAHAADIPVTVVTVPVIGSATYAKKILAIQGSDFGATPKVFVNGADHSAQITSTTDTSISLKGKKKKLGLHTGENRIVVVDAAGTSSDEFVLIL